MKEFLKVVSNMDTMSFILAIIPLPFVLGAFVCAYDLIFNNVVKMGACIDTLLLLLTISALMYFGFGLIIKDDYLEVKSELKK
jgi:hypothetical protein